MVFVEQNILYLITILLTRKSISLNSKQAEKHNPDVDFLFWRGEEESEEQALLNIFRQQITGNYADFSKFFKLIIE